MSVGSVPIYIQAPLFRWSLLSDLPHMHLQSICRHFGAVTKLWLFMLQMQLNFALLTRPASLPNRFFQEKPAGPWTSLHDLPRSDPGGEWQFCTCEAVEKHLLEQLQHLDWAASCSSIHSTQEQPSTFPSGHDDPLYCSEPYYPLPSPSHLYKMLPDQNTTQTWLSNTVLMKIIFSVSNTFPVVCLRY